eukprot:CAMPEP_0197856052 /NCGR_PEP_ID=MMETSP1438-20131217/27794_1 /TAXON_ID=1461541 /ORGANISM="Pterosperma sp., Strain CCMP1384" /LENGTH=773 /DNA_ID=CAMNT_0043471375 /DNA_START=252 /DNA_END=2570 /DNA_ORIENTATION=-
MTLSNSDLNDERRQSDTVRETSNGVDIPRIADVTAGIRFNAADLHLSEVNVNAVGSLKAANTSSLEISPAGLSKGEERGVAACKVVCLLKQLVTPLGRLSRDLSDCEPGVRCANGGFDFSALQGNDCSSVEPTPEFSSLFTHIIHCKDPAAATVMSDIETLCSDKSNVAHATIADLLKQQREACESGAINGERSCTSYCSLDVEKPPVPFYCKSQTSTTQPVHISKTPLTNCTNSDSAEPTGSNVCGTCPAPPPATPDVLVPDSSSTDVIPQPGIVEPSTATATEDWREQQPESMACENPPEPGPAHTALESAPIHVGTGTEQSLHTEAVSLQDMVYDPEGAECASDSSSSFLSAESAEERERSNSQQVPGPEPSSRKRQALDGEWKRYRRGLEWRCRWLEVRMKELQKESTHYENLEKSLLAQREAQREAQQGSASASEPCESGLPAEGSAERHPPSSARTTPSYLPSNKSEKLWRRRHRKRPLSPKAALQAMEHEVSHHPVLGRLSRGVRSQRKRRKSEAGGPRAGQKIRVTYGRGKGKGGLEDSDNVEKEMEGDGEYDDLSASDSDISTIVMYQQLQGLLERVNTLRSELHQHHTASTGGGRSRGSASSNAYGRDYGVGGTLPKGIRRNHSRSDADINEMVTPGGLGVRIERLPSVEIFTPGVRKLTVEELDALIAKWKAELEKPSEDPTEDGVSADQLAEQSGNGVKREDEKESAELPMETEAREESSGEDTSDECYYQRHASLEVEERRRLLPVAGRGDGRRRGRGAQ